MNVFILDEDFEKSAQYNVDRHVVKIVTECAQILAAGYIKNDAPYAHTHYNNPWCKFVRNSKKNFEFLLQHGQALAKEYTYRYEKIHKSEHVLNWYIKNPPNLKDLELTEIPRCFGLWKDQIPENLDIVESYRKYYLLAKPHLFNWKNREKPYWIDKISEAINNQK